MKMVLPSGDRTSEVLEPGEKTFHFPSPPVSSKRASILGFQPFPVRLVRGDHFSPFLFKAFAQRVAIVDFIANDLVRLLLAQRRFLVDLLENLPNFLVRGILIHRIFRCQIDIRLRTAFAYHFQTMR
jgi:hypothetical protein